MTIPIEKQVDCAKRELKMRQRVYGRGIQDGRMDEAKCALEIAAMEAIVATLERVQSTEGAQPELL
ncbi:MAG: hypothetical protein WCL08_01055 [Verrucomicrobiota bacterium]